MEGESSLDHFISIYKFPIIFGLIGLVLLISGVISSGLIQKTFQKTTNITSKSTSGAVVSPGVYYLQPGVRVEEVIKAAGGITDQANVEFVNKTLNLAQKVSDGMKIYIPSQTENQNTNSTQAQVAGVANQTSGQININSATLEQLDSLPGIGAVTAQKIIDNRPYSSVDDLQNKKVVTRAMFLKIKDQVAIY